MLLFLNERSFIFKKQGGAKMAPPQIIQYNCLSLARHLNCLVNNAGCTLQRRRNKGNLHINVINFNIYIVAPCTAHDLPGIVINLDLYFRIFVS